VRSERESKNAKGSGVRGGLRSRVGRAAIGIEAEFTLLVDGVPAAPEDVFHTPTRLVRAPMMHRVGRSYHLPTGSAIYFDSGVIELATPMIEIAPGCAARAGRALWESIRFLRRELDAWEESNGKALELRGFSTHYNVSFDLAKHVRVAHRTIEKLALLQTYVVPIPVMLLATNRRSTGVGVRPRGNRIEVTADFTPDPALMIAAAAFVVGSMRAVMRWPSFELSVLDDAPFPVIRDFAPERHRSRHGWVARFSSFPRNPFMADVDAPLWIVDDGEARSLRDIGGRIASYFWPSIRRVGDPRTLRLIGRVMSGDEPSLLELDDRPAAYDRVGRLCRWTNLFPPGALSRSRYERVLMHAVSRHTLRLRRDRYVPTGTRGWSAITFLRERDGSRHVFSLDFLLDHLDAWTTRRRPTVVPNRAAPASSTQISAAAVSKRDRSALHVSAAIDEPRDQQPVTLEARGIALPGGNP
jgi:hypothetical protein